jgi:cell division protein FtsI (penicillin-binding protein 3)
VVDRSADSWRATVKRRLAVVFFGLLLWSAGIEARLVYLQVVQHDVLTQRAERQQQKTRVMPAKRGDILDRDGGVLAMSVEVESIFVDPSQIEDPEGLVGALCGAFEDCTSDERRDWVARIRQAQCPDRCDGKYFKWIRRHVPSDQAGRAAALELDGVGFIGEELRRYPNGQLASHLVGYVGLDNNGLAGVEAKYDTLILGDEGTVLVQNDAQGRTFNRVDRPPTVGAALELTVDRYVQHVAERELRAGVRAVGAAAGSAVVMDPRTGQILALANYPTFDPNTFSSARPPARRNRAVLDYYEPGSTFKIVTASAALERGEVTPGTMIDASAGQIRFGRRVILDDHNYGRLTFADAIVKSSNVGAIKVALQVGPTVMDAYSRSFGFGRPSSPDFGGENAGMVYDAKALNDSALASVAMGYQVGVTPLQMAAAVSAVANGGELIEPRLVGAVIRDGERMPVPRRVRHRVITAGTSATLTEIMEQVVERGTGREAQVPGYRVAGKTGTAKKMVDGTYQGHRDYNVSFVGFVPSRAPELAIVVVVDTPRNDSRYGGTVAAPIFREIARSVLRHRGVPPSLDRPEPVRAGRWDVASRRPLPGAIAASLAAPDDAADGRGLPDLSGLSARDALRGLARLGIVPRVRGTGVVVGQTPAPGATVGAGSPVVLRLERRSTVPESGDGAP